MAMGKRKRGGRQSTIWIATNDVPTTAADPFYERLNRILDKAGFDAHVEGLCARFYAETMGRPSLAPGRYFRLLLIGYFEGLDSERAIAWRAADSFALRRFLDMELVEAPPDHSTISRTRRLIDLETHREVFTSILKQLAEAGLVVGVTVQDADQGDTHTSIETLIEAAEQIEAVVADSEGPKELVADRGYHSNQALVALEAVGVRSYISEPDRGRRKWKDNPEARDAVYGNRRRIRGARGRRLMRHAENFWNGRLRICMKAEGCDASTCAVTRTSSNAYCCTRRR